ncbi:MAG: porin [Sideroxyarcus sp.]|nr:porin [Sideroxyarcus sp.]
MKQKIIALAIAAAFSAPAFADNANVSFYGKAFLTVDQYDSGVAGASSQMRVNTNASRFGVKGSEDIGGLKGIFQYEVEMDADGSAGNGLGKTRNSGLGLEGGFGKVVLGVWDTPFKTAHNKIELFDNTTNWTAVKVIGISAGKDYNTRQKNMVQYWSPKMGALQAAVMYSPDEAKTTAKNASILSLSGTYDQDAIYVSAAYESRNDVTVGTTDNALRLVGKYNLGDFWLGAMAERIKTNTSTTTDVSGTNMELVGEFKMGASRIAASYTKAGSTAVGAAAANDVNQIAVKYAYAFSKRTEAFAAYGSKKTNNTTSTTANTFGGGLIHSF